VTLVVPVIDVDSARQVVNGVLLHPYPGRFEVLVAAGPSTARAAAELVGATADPRVGLVRASSDALADQMNVAALAGQHSIVSRAMPGPNFGPELLRRAVIAMQVTGADVVGGAAVAVGLGTAERAASRAMNSRLGVGPRPSRLGGRHGAVDSVRMVAIRRTIFERVGGLDQSFAGAQDWELQHRVRQAGGMVWLDPALAVSFTPQVKTGDIARRFFRAGSWRRSIMARHPGTGSPRYFAAPALLVSLAALVLTGIVGALLGQLWLLPLAAAPLAYGLGLAIAVAVAGRDLRFGGRIRMWWMVLVMHLSWGAGFLRGGRGQPTEHGRSLGG
jgi:hypothetical protein